MIGTPGTAQPADLADVRTTNLAVVLRHVRHHTPCSRADIAAATGLNKATVSSLVADLLERGLLRETGMAENRIGRPAAMLTLHGRPYAAVGIQVAADHLAAVAIDLAGERLLSWRRAFPGLAATGGRAEAAVAALAGRVAAKLTAQERRILGLTVAVPGAVTGTGGVRFAPHLGWSDLDLRPALMRTLRHPPYDVVVDNDANLAALAEHRSGPHAGTPDLVALIGGVGVSAGIVAGGRLVRGDRGLSGQVGHLQLDPSGPLCRCGRRGCLEAYAGLPALVRTALPDTEADGPITDYAPEIDRMAALAAGDATVSGALAEAGRRIGHAVSVLADLLDPRVVVLGGAFTPLAPWLLPAVEAEVKARATAPEQTGRIVVSTLDPGAVAAGGAALALDRLEAGHLPGCD
ncbi:ROK family transcriptional regulator [Mangrovihabitans endophyticus]|uniref:Xylose repressor n=1 Tax=Mangrovihabitans endophyticus TaxID=1751298 RepID=A0A8J3C662_9ACTN|nr:ROK family transcriptional regulator [Mangrovihabitans endophyticus]GGL14266.1 xylose repressor [Mangrovihabitans endophyticus]